ncbi:MAG: hydrolase 1, exosortase A system-associated [Colwellia sp.]|nr:hydrolase 1, exosortase A system-associated [Colwellia sp.]
MKVEAIENPVVFQSQNNQLLGIYHQAVDPAHKAVIIVVGGPQTRVGSHRQFLLLARQYAKQGIDVLRFDYSGAGDSEGDVTEFTEITADIGAAVDVLLKQNTSINHITLWGLCDAASAILIYLAKTKDERIKQVILLNPWVRQVSTEAKVYLRTYYFKRFFQKSFWKKLLKGHLKTRSTVNDIKNFQRLSKQKQIEHNFVDLMLYGSLSFSGTINVILSGNDLTADEFNLLIKSDGRWQKLLKGSTHIIETVKNANHTFSTSLWHKQMSELSLRVVTEYVDEKN